MDINICNLKFRDILPIIFKNLSIYSLRNFRLTCKYLQKLVEEYTNMNKIDIKNPSARYTIYRDYYSGPKIYVITCSDIEADIELIQTRILKK